jgi:hypothetical protein
LYYNNYLEKMLVESKLKENREITKTMTSSSSSSSFGCEICNTKPAKKALATSINEFYKDGTIKIHYTCSKHIVDIYNKIVKEIENK